MTSFITEIADVTAALRENCYSISLHLKRSSLYEALGYPDLAVLDAYKALLLVDEVLDEGFEYHHVALESLLADPEAADVSSLDEHAVKQLCDGLQAQCLLLIASNLALIGCLKPAYEYASRALAINSANAEARQIITQIISSFRHETGEEQTNGTQGEFDWHNLPERGFVRREVYPWNGHEVDRTKSEAVEMLNGQLASVAPKLEVRATELPLLSGMSEDEATGERRTVVQLGIFAKEDLSAGEKVLRERSLLTANTRAHGALCDACNATLPSQAVSEAAEPTPIGDSPTNVPVPCPDCDEAVFCGEKCRELAQRYHPAVCGIDVEAQKDVPHAKATDTLYTMLLCRALALSLTQEVHPLDLREVKYIWGDFSSTASAPMTPSKDAMGGQPLFRAHPRTLPFSFGSNVLTPLHMLEKMDVDVFASAGDIAELWVWNTLLAKIRGTASARMDPRDGRPEVAAVHPLWCLANHSCDPNVAWEWAGEISFEVRRGRAAWRRQRPGADAAAAEAEEVRPGTHGRGIRKGEEILSHYVDIDLPAAQRREWGAGALGGLCTCTRCLWELDA